MSKSMSSQILYFISLYIRENKALLLTENKRNNLFVYVLRLNVDQIDYYGIQEMYNDLQLLKVLTLYLDTHIDTRCF